jgi:hypothetical protein
MALFEADRLLLKGQVQRSYTIQAVPDLCYEYLSDIRTLLSQVPHVSRIQVGKISGKARAYFNMTVMSIPLDAVLDIEPLYQSEDRTIHIKNAREPMGEVPNGYLTGQFNALIKVRPTEKGHSRISSQIILAFDGNQLIERNLFPRSLIENSGQTLLQEYAERLCDDYVINLLENFRKWVARR